MDGEDAVHLTLLVKAETSKKVDGHHPYIALCITVHSGAKVLECFVELCFHLLVLARWNNRLHGIEVEHLRSFLKSYPKALEMVFIYIAATVAAKTDGIGAQSEVHEIEAIVAYQSTTMGADPDEAIGILEYVVGEVIRHSRRHVEVAYVIATRGTALCINAQGNEKCAYYGENVSNH